MTTNNHEEKIIGESFGDKLFWFCFRVVILIFSVMAYISFFLDYQFK